MTKRPNIETLAEVADRLMAVRSSLNPNQHEFMWNELTLLAQDVRRLSIGNTATADKSAATEDADCERMEKDFYATVGRYCTFGPPAERKRQWIILFEDADKGMMIFDDEREAHTAWDRAKDNWTCTLYETAHRKFVFAAGQLRTINEPQRARDPAVVAYVQHAILAHPHFEGGAALAFGLANTTIDAFTSALSRPKGK